MNWYDQQTRRTRRPRRIEEVHSAEIGFPIVWVLIGALSAMLIIGLVGLGALNILRRQAITPTPPTIANLAPTQPIAQGGSMPIDPGSSPTIPPVVTLPPTVTPVPSTTPLPKPPAEISKNGFATIINTDGAGVSLRGGPGTDKDRLGVVLEGLVVEIKDGPQDSQNPDDAAGYPTWWKVKAPDGQEGWIASNFLQPSLTPKAKIQ